MNSNENNKNTIAEYKSLINLGLLFLKLKLTTKEYGRIEMIAKMLSDDEYFKKCKVSIIGKKKGLDLLILNENGDKLEEKLASYNHSTISIVESEKLECCYTMNDSELKITHYPKGNKGTYFKIEIYHKNYKLAK
jgi:hypothetical protein